jgi:hypothetical protein
MKFYNKHKKLKKGQGNNNFIFNSKLKKKTKLHGLVREQTILYYTIYLTQKVMLIV